MVFCPRKTVIQKELLLLCVLPSVKQLDFEGDHSSLSSTEIYTKKKSVELYPHSPIRLHDMIYNSAVGQF